VSLTPTNFFEIQLHFSQSIDVVLLAAVITEAFPATCAKKQSLHGSIYEVNENHSEACKA
jgi:hypothetical protein